MRSAASWGTDGDAARERDDPLAGSGAQAEVAQPVGGDERIVGIGVGQDHRELVAADAEGTVAVAQRVADGVGHAHAAGGRRRDGPRRR